MALDRTFLGHWYTTCGDCQGVGPLGETSKLAREYAKNEGWSRIYRGGRGETFICPGCRLRP